MPINEFRVLLSDGISSLGSEDSSGNSEKSLPRVIKPRKRRKKDRKNAQQQQLFLLLNQQQSSQPSQPPSHQQKQKHQQCQQIQSQSQQQPQQQQQYQTPNGLTSSIESLSVNYLGSAVYSSSYHHNHYHLVPSGPFCAGRDTMHYFPFMLTYGQTGYHHHPFPGSTHPHPSHHPASAAPAPAPTPLTANSVPITTKSSSSLPSSSSAASSSPGYNHHHANHSSSINGSQKLSNYGFNYSTDLILAPGCGYSLEGSTGHCKGGGIPATKKNCDNIFYINNSPSSSPCSPLPSKGPHYHQQAQQLHLHHQHNHLHRQHSTNLVQTPTGTQSARHNIQSDCPCLDCLSPTLNSSRPSSSAFLTPPMSPLVEVNSFFHLLHHHQQQQQKQLTSQAISYQNNETPELQHRCSSDGLQKFSEPHNPELEFSTRIVTNPSGGRDLEIKFLNLSGSRQLSWPDSSSQQQPKRQPSPVANYPIYLNHQESNSGFSLNSYEREFQIEY